MTREEQAEFYGLNIKTVIRRRRLGIPMDAPKVKKPPPVPPKGQSVKRKCPGCKHYYPVRSKACPVCGQLAPPKGTKSNEQRKDQQ